MIRWEPLTYPEAKSRLRVRNIHFHSPVRSGITILRYSSIPQDTYFEMNMDSGVFWREGSGPVSRSGRPDNETITDVERWNG